MVISIFNCFASAETHICCCTSYSKNREKNVLSGSGRRCRSLNIKINCWYLFFFNVTIFFDVFVIHGNTTSCSTSISKIYTEAFFLNFTEPRYQTLSKARVNSFNQKPNISSETNCCFPFSRHHRGCTWPSFSFKETILPFQRC